MAGLAGASGDAAAVWSGWDPEDQRAIVRTFEFDRNELRERWQAAGLSPEQPRRGAKKQKLGWISGCFVPPQHTLQVPEHHLAITPELLLYHVGGSVSSGMMQGEGRSTWRPKANCLWAGPWDLGLRQCHAAHRAFSPPTAAARVARPRATQGHQGHLVDPRCCRGRHSVQGASCAQQAGIHTRNWHKLQKGAPTCEHAPWPGACS